MENIVVSWDAGAAAVRFRDSVGGARRPKSRGCTVRCCMGGRNIVKSVALQKRMSVHDWQQGECHIVVVYIVIMHASYQGLSYYKSALDVWSSCVRLVRLSRLLESCGIRKQYYRSYCCSSFVSHSATLVKWLGHVTLHYQQRTETSVPTTNSTNSTTSVSRYIQP